MDCQEYTHADEVEKKLNAAMPWVALYITAASTVCTLAMAADVFNGFRQRKLWFPCRYFSLNATSLTLLAIAMKLPMDINTVMINSVADFFVKPCSLIIMSTALANFMSSLGSINDKSIRPNVVALGILVITIVGNICIQIIALDLVSVNYFVCLWLPAISMLLLLLALVSLAITLPTTKRSLESKYQEKHKVVLREEEALNRREAFTIDNQRGHMMKYLVMAETSTPQFVMARSVVCTTSAVISLCTAIILATFTIVLWTSIKHEPAASPYGYYTKWILCIQSIGVAVGTIAPMSRWFIVVSNKCSTTNWNSLRKGFKIEAYWVQTLVEWRDSFSTLQIRQGKWTKFLHDVKWFTLTFCIGIQVTIVLVSKLLVLLSAMHISPLILCFTYTKKFLKRIRNEAGDDTDLNLGHYVLLLEGEAELPRRVLKNICREADNIIKTGRENQPKSLIDLLHKFVDFNGVGEFDTNQVSSLHSKEPPNCWTLPVVTLTSIAVALPNIAMHKRKRLLNSVSEGLSLAKIVEKTLVKNAELVNIKKAADICWARVALYTKWLDIDLKRTSLKRKNSKEVLRDLSHKAEWIIMDFKRDAEDPIMENPLNWPAKVVAANSMYRISRTILLSCEDENEQTDEGLFERLCIMIADILAACLTNLSRVITTMCHRNAIEKREKSVREAFLLLSKTEQIAQLLQQQEWPSLDDDKAAYIDEWRALFWQDKGDPKTPTTTSSDEAGTTPESSSSEEHIAVRVDC